MALAGYCREGLSLNIYTAKVQALHMSPKNTACRCQRPDTRDSHPAWGHVGGKAGDPVSLPFSVACPKTTHCHARRAQGRLPGS